LSVAGAVLSLDECVFASVGPDPSTRRSCLRAGIVGPVLALAAALVLALAPHAAADSTVTVASPCTLPDAVAYADGSAEPACAPAPASGTTTIDLPASTTPYTVSTTLSFTADTIVNGGGEAGTTISGGGAVEVVGVASGAVVTLHGVTITGGVSGAATTGCTGPLLDRSCPAEDGLNGGGISNAGTLTLTNSVVTGNTASAGTLPFSQVHLLCFINCPASPGATAGSGGNGGGIYNSGTLTVTNSTISDNTAGSGGNGSNGASGTGTNASQGQLGGSGGAAGDGGGIDNVGGTATIANSLITANSAGDGGDAGAGSTATLANSPGGDAGSSEVGGRGGGIASSGTLTVTGSTLAGNSSGAGGSGASGAAASGSGAAGLSSASSGGGSGGGVLTEGLAPASFANDTISANTTAAGGTGGSAAGSGGDGGGLATESLAVNLSFVTVAQNAAAGEDGGLDNASVGLLTETDSIVASNTGGGAPSNCSPYTPTIHVTDGGNNLVFGDNSCPGTNADPKLDLLAANGGATATMALVAGSAAIGLVPLNACPLTSDQRGVARPQGMHCDAGAYEFAPPIIASPTATATSASTATVSASINPNAQPATVMVNYGATPAYGSSTRASGITPATAPEPFSTPVTGLSPNATYHAQIVATNADGTSTSTDLTFTTLPASTLALPLSVSIAAPSNAGATLSLTVTCRGATSATTCSGQITLTSKVSRRRGSVVAVAASKPKPPKRSSTATKIETVGSGSYSVASGSSARFRIGLNHIGHQLLNRFYKLPVTITVGDSPPLITTFTFRYTVIRSPISFMWAWRPGATIARKLTISRIPSAGRLTVICHGGGCPFAKRTITPRHGQVALAPTLAHSPLAPSATLELQITAANKVGEVAIFTIKNDRQPSLRKLCMPPGARHPSRCV
jgi:hypothetical protein